MPMKKLLPLAGLAAILAGCDATVTVINHTPFGVRVLVYGDGAADGAVAPTAGNRSDVETFSGPYSITAFLDEEWIAWAKTTRKVLNDRLADSQHLTGPELLDVVQRLRDIATKMQAYESVTGPPAAGSPGAGHSIPNSSEWTHRTWCDGEIPKDGAGAEVTITEDRGRLIATCRTKSEK